MNFPIRRIHMGPARCAADLTDGSERGEYVPQDYILQTLGRPMRSVNLMYCYYPLDETFPLRARDAFADREIKSQWDTPYEDYFPYTGGLVGGRDGAVFQQMQDIRRHGQDVTLTLVIDPNTPDEHLVAIAEDLKPYGRLLLRINHEATGDWFAFNKRADYAQIAQFFVRASDIIRTHAPNVQIIACIGGIEDPDSDTMVKEEEFTCTVHAADIWSVDKYMALHWGWPYDLAEKGGITHNRHSYKDVYDLTKSSFRRFTELSNGETKPMVMSEFNADGDVTGPYEQCDMVDGFFRLVKDDPEDWLKAINFYQFRDRGRLGLEIEDPNHPETGIPQPVMQTFKKWIQDPLFLPEIIECGDITLPVTLRWGNSEDAEGLAVPVRLTKHPHFFELYFHDNNNYMIECHGKWFYKAPDTKCIDLMPAFFSQRITEPLDLTLKIFAPPASGMNDLECPDGLMNSYTTITALPDIRLAYAPVEPARE